MSQLLAPAGSSGASGEIRSESQPIALATLVCQVLYPAYLVSNFFYFLHQGKVTYPGLLVVACAVGMLIAPRSASLVAVATALHLIENLSVEQQSNHLIISTFASFGLLYCYCVSAVKGRTLSPSVVGVYESFAPLGRWLLIIMYFYGVFHKLNADFINPATSCASYLWRAYNLPLGLSEWLPVHYLAIYGTLVVETLTVIFLVMPRYRFLGIILGVSFHLAIGFNDFDLRPTQARPYIAFSVLCIFLHALFLPSGFLGRIGATPWGRVVGSSLSSAVNRGSATSLIVLALVLIPNDLLWLAFGLSALTVVAVFGRERAPFEPVWPSLWPRSAMLGVFAVAFFVNGALPYVGFKTGQAIAMFSNLTTENGESNHLIVQKTLGLFPQQSRVAKVIKTDIPGLNMPPGGNYGIIEWSLLDRFERSGLPVVYMVGDTQVVLDASARQRIASELPPRFIRQLFPFKLVHLDRPRPCDKFS